MGIDCPGERTQLIKHIAFRLVQETTPMVKNDYWLEEQNESKIKL